MTIQLSPQEIDLEMRRYKEELKAGVRESIHEWGIGSWTLSKFGKTWRIGWAHTLHEGAKWIAYRFTWQGDGYVGLVFDSAADKPEWYMAGWYRDYNAAVAQGVVDFLNAEIADRLAGKVSKYDGRVGLAKDLEDAMYAYEDEVEARRNSYRFERSPRVKALFEQVDRELAEKRRNQDAGSAENNDEARPPSEGHGDGKKPT